MDIQTLKDKAKWVRSQTMYLHGLAPQTRIASSLSCVEILVALFYGGIMRFNIDDVLWEGRDRLIISKGHGSIAMYPILADFGLIKKDELRTVCTQGSRLGSIPDPTVPGYETINGSLGQGLGVACGVALALEQKKSKSNVFVLSGDGELFEGSVWEAIMFAGQHRLINLRIIIDNNKVCMLDYCRNIIDLEPLEDKFANFGWDVKRVDGHNIQDLLNAINSSLVVGGKPMVIIADTVKGKGVKRLEIDSLSHIKMLSAAEVDMIIEKMR